MGVAVINMPLKPVPIWAPLGCCCLTVFKIESNLQTKQNPGHRSPAFVPQPRLTRNEEDIAANRRTTNTEAASEQENKKRLTELLTSSCSLSCSRLTVSSQSRWMAPNEDTCECLHKMSFVMEKYLSKIIKPVNKKYRGPRSATPQYTRYSATLAKHRPRQDE